MLIACGDGMDIKLAGGRIRDLGPAEAGTSAGGAPSDDGGFQVTPGCSGFACQRVACLGQPKTTISGVVYDPAGKVPLYNIVVYVPRGDLVDIADGPQCQTCSGFGKSERAVALTLSRADGSFVVEDVPAGRDIPLVFQVGKWRREIIVPEVPPCTETRLSDPATTRLPRNQSEGHVPKIAIATGGSDALECLVRKIGVDEAEFTNEDGSGRVNLFYGWQAINKVISPEPSTMKNGTVQLTPADALWGDATLLDRYDMMLLSCEGSDNIERTDTEYKNVRHFADIGGRIYGSHWHHNWIRPNAMPSDLPDVKEVYPEVVKFSKSAHGFDTSITVPIDETFPKGKSFSDWLANVGASPPGMPGFVKIQGAEHSVDSVIPPFAHQWIYGTDTTYPASKPVATPMVQYFSINTPIDTSEPDGGAECGRMVFSDVHVSTSVASGDAGTDNGKLPFPEGCRTPDLSPQEKALEFMIFDLSSCVQSDSAEPFIR